MGSSCMTTVFPHMVSSNEVVLDNDRRIYLNSNAILCCQLCRPYEQAAPENSHLLTKVAPLLDFSKASGIKHILPVPAHTLTLPRTPFLLSMYAHD